MKKALLLLLLIFSVSAMTKTPKELIKIAVIDTGLDLNDPRFKDYLCSTGHRDFTGEGIKDIDGHGTHVAGLIVKYAKNANYCLVIYKYYSDNLTGRQNYQNELYALAQATKENVSFVNFSGGGHHRTNLEYQLIKKFSKITFVVAAGNEGRSLDDLTYSYYPAKYKFKNVITVGNLNKDRTINESSNFGKKVVWEVGTDIKSTCLNNTICEKNGSSMSTAVKTGKLVYETWKNIN
jgi:major intracellular serine protease